MAKGKFFLEDYQTIENYDWTPLLEIYGGVIMNKRVL